MAERTPKPEIHPVLTWLTPQVADLLFFVEKDAKLPVNQKFEFGDSFWDKTRYPDHKLVYVSPQDDQNWSRWYYAADREHQDDYNWELRNNDTVFRTYLVPRADYPENFETPTVGTADTKFTDYIFAGESVERVDKELDSLYVLVRRTYSIETLVTYQWDESLKHPIKITRQIVPAGTVIGSGSSGRIVEVQPGDKFYDLKITSEVVWDADEVDQSGDPVFPIQLDSIASDANYRFPPLLKSVELFGAWAYATSDGAAPSYSEDFFFETDICEPHPGPFEATVYRYLTDNPDLVRALNPTTKIVSREETFGLVRWWAASSDNGNNTYALARQYTTPPTVHDDVPLPAVVNYTQGGGMSGVANAPGSQKLPATPNFSSYIASTITTAGVETKRARLGLWEVHVIKIHAGGATVYGGDENVFRTKRSGTGSGTVPGQGGGLPTVTIWRQPKANTPTNVNPADRTYAGGGSFTLRVWALEDWEWSVANLQPGPDWLTCTESPGQSATYPDYKDLVFTYGPNNTGDRLAATIELQGEDYHVSHYVEQPNL